MKNNITALLAKRSFISTKVGKKGYKTILVDIYSHTTTGKMLHITIGGSMAQMGSIWTGPLWRSTPPTVISTHPPRSWKSGKHFNNMVICHCKDSKRRRLLRVMLQCCSYILNWDEEIFTENMAFCQKLCGTRNLPSRCSNSCFSCNWKSDIHFNIWGGHLPCFGSFLPGTDSV